jgi:ABC-type transporter Mla subunit MlaD
MADITIRISGKTQKIVAVVLGGMFAAILVVHFWSSGSFRPHYLLRMYVARAAGVTEGSAVRIDGIDVGSVSAVKSSDAATSPDRSIELILKIEKRYQDRIRSDSAAFFLTEGLTGNRYVTITRGFRGSILPPDGEVTAASERMWNEKDTLDALDTLKLIPSQSAKKNGSGDK